MNNSVLVTEKKKILQNSLLGDDMFLFSNLETKDNTAHTHRDTCAEMGVCVDAESV